MKGKLLVALMLASLLTQLPGSLAAGEKPLVVTTIAPLAGIIKEAFGDSVDVVYIIPPGADPHDYQLTTEQIRLLQKASVIVTTGGHLPMEKKIAELRGEGTITGRVLFVDDYRVFGFRYLKEHWYGDKDNPHGVWLDPTNALAIALATERALEESDPSNAGTYRMGFERFKERVQTIVSAYRTLIPVNATAVIQMPPDEYAIEWLGIKAVAAIKPEEEVPAKGVDELLPAAESSTIIVYGSDSPDQLKKAALELAAKSGKPSAEITVFWGGKPYTEVLIENTASIIKALGGRENTGVPKRENEVGRYVLVSLVAGLVLGTALGVVLKK